MMVHYDPEFYRGKRVFVTGHTGFKGSWLCKMLLMAGAEVTGYSLQPPTQPNLFSIAGVEGKMHSVIGDIRDFDALKAAFDAAQPDIVLHLAAQPIVRDSYKDPRYTYETNVMGTVNLLECVRLAQQQGRAPRSVLNVTTDKVYHNNEWAWGYRENEPLDGFDPYSNSKSCSELATHSYINSFFADKTVAVSTARAGNVIGGGDFANDRIIPDCVRAMAAGRKIGVRNPYSTRPYQHVLEPLAAYLLIAQRQYEDSRFAGYYNVGPDDCDCVTTGTLVDLFCRAWGGAPIFKVFFYPLYSSNYMDGSIGYPLELGVRPWVFVLLLMLAVLAWSLFQTTAIGRIAKTENIAPFAACLSVLGLVSFSYYANRSAWMNLEICLPEALLCLCFPLQALTDGEGLRKKLGGLYCTAAQSVGLAVLLVLCVLTAQLPGGVMNTVILQERGAFSTRGIYAEVENFSANIPDNTFAVGRDVGIIYHAAGWDNYGHYVDAADYGVADTEKLLPHILAELKAQPSFVVDDILGVYLGQNGYTPDMLGYQLQTTFTSAGGTNPITYYYYEKQ